MLHDHAPRCCQCNTNGFCKDMMEKTLDVRKTRRQRFEIAARARHWEECVYIVDGGAGVNGFINLLRRSEIRLRDPMGWIVCGRQGCC